MKLNDYLKDKTFDSAEIHNLSSGSFSLPGGRIIKAGESKTLEELGLSKEIFDKFCRENHLENLTDSPKAKLKIKGIKQSLVKVEKEVVENLLVELATDEKEKNISNSLNPEVKEEDNDLELPNEGDDNSETVDSSSVDKDEVESEVDSTPATEVKVEEVTVVTEPEVKVEVKTETATTKKRASKAKEDAKIEVEPEEKVEV